MPTPETAATESLIGKPYWPIDNSCAICLNDTKLSCYLAGHNMSEPKEQEQVEIISEPFQAVAFMSRNGEKDYMDFVLVKDSLGRFHRVLFFEAALQPKPAREEDEA